MSTVQDDFKFVADDQGELPHQSDRLCYVAAINPQLTRKQFVAEAVLAGYHPNTAAIQFAKSRRVSVSCGDVVLAEDGRLIGITEQTT